MSHDEPWLAASTVSVEDPAIRTGASGSARLHVWDFNLEGIASEEAMRELLGDLLTGSDELNVFNRKHHVLAYRSLGLSREYSEGCFLYEIVYRDAGPIWP